jgi:2,4-dienoyl-CoA reductase-like NADH-dependent reductase (Old Yellow Enzyme family)
MSILFTEQNIGPIKIKNRFISSACEDNLASDTGEVTESIISKNEQIARGETGLLISSQMYVHPLGRTRKKETGIHNDTMIRGLKKLVEIVHKYGGKIVIQLGHAGIQASGNVTGQKPQGPSSDNPLAEGMIHEIIESFVNASLRAAEAGADGIQLHAAHGYLINEFLSPYFNRRKDLWGGSIDNRFRFPGEIIKGIKRVMPDNMAFLIKLNSNDYTPEEGITPPLAAEYASRLSGMNIDGIEVSCGTSMYSPYKMCMGNVPVKELLLKYPDAQTALKNMDGKYALHEGYNSEAARFIKPYFNSGRLFSVGGWREVASMEEAVDGGYTDFISMCRPFIKDPFLVRHIKEKKVSRASCISCNKCLAAFPNDLPVRCYINGF